VTRFDQLLSVLVRHGVQFIIVGGAAATVHGSARLTQDLDIVYHRTDENLERLIRSLAPYQPYLRGAPPNLPFKWNKETVQAGLNFTLITSLGAIDLLGEITGGGTYENLLPDSVQIQVFGIECMCLSLKRLIEVKKATGRVRDFEAIAELEAILEEKKRSGI